MNRPRICAVIVDNDLTAVRQAEELADWLEVRIDLIGQGWPELVRQLSKPWIACNRSAVEGGQWKGSETDRIDELLKAAELGADIVDIELRTTDLAQAVAAIKGKTKCLVSFHDLEGTPPLPELKELVRGELTAGADICKVVTTAQSFDDNITVLQLISEFPETRIISFAMGQPGLISRVLCPLVGGYLTYASIEEGKESASGQITARQLREIYQGVAKC